MNQGYRGDIGGVVNVGIVFLPAPVYVKGVVGNLPGVLMAARNKTLFLTGDGKQKQGADIMLFSGLNDGREIRLVGQERVSLV